MIKFRFLLVVLCLFFVVRPGFAEDSPGIQKIVKRGKLLVAVYDADFLPMFGRDKKGNLIGHDIELARYLAKNLGVPVEFVLTKKSFDDVIDLVSEGKADIAISLITPTLARARKVTFSTPYLYVDLRLVYNRLTAAKLDLTSPANQIRNIPGLKIAVIRGSAFVENIKKHFPLAIPVEYPSVESTLPDIQTGKIFAFFGDSADISYSLSQKSDTRLFFGASKLKNVKDPIVIAISWQYPDFISWVNLAIQLRKLSHTDIDFEKQYASQPEKT